MVPGLLLPGTATSFRALRNAKIPTTTREALNVRPPDQPSSSGICGGARVILVAIAVVAAASPVWSQEPVTPPVLTDDALLHKYVLNTLGGSGMLHAAVAASFDQLRESPDEWDADGAGYAKRWASEFAASAIGSTTKYGVAKALHHDPSFARCKCLGFGARMRHALVSPFTARRRDGHEVFSPATIAGLAAENIVPASTWYPAPHGVRDGVSHSVTGVLAKAAVNVLREFVSFKPFH